MPHARAHPNALGQALAQGHTRLSLAQFCMCSYTLLELGAHQCTRVRVRKHTLGMQVHVHTRALGLHPQRASLGGSLGALGVQLAQDQHSPGCRRLVERGEDGFWCTLHLRLCVCPCWGWFLHGATVRQEGVLSARQPAPRPRTGLQFSFPFMALCCCSLCSINLSDAG